VAVGRSTAPSAFTRVRRLAEKAAYERETLYAVLDAGTHCHLAHVVEGRPVCTPTLHWRVGDRVYWHGSRVSRMLKTLEEGGEVCLTVTLMDGWVLARSAFNHSANYRAAMCFGRPTVVEAAADKAELLEAFTERWFPGRWSQLRPMTRKELAATTVMSLGLDEASAKVAAGGVGDPAADLSWPVWAGVVPMPHRLGRPVPDAGLAPGLAPPRVAAHGRTSGR
jgi:hypothetical protein